MDENKEKLEVLGNSAVQDHISMHQDIINRMAGNSANCKNWTITLVAAMLVLLVDKKMQIPNAWPFLIPIILFYLLDCYYLGLERMCIASQNEFLEKVKNGNDYIDSLYKMEAIKDNSEQLCNTIKAMVSLSTIPFYLIVAIAIVILYFGAL